MSTPASPQPGAGEQTPTSTQLDRYERLLSERAHLDVLGEIEAELLRAGVRGRGLAIAAIELAHRSRNLVLTTAAPSSRLAAYVHAYRLFDRYDWIEAAKAAETALNHWPRDPFLVAVRAAGDTAGGIPTGPRGLSQVARDPELVFEVGMIAARGYWNAPPSEEVVRALLELVTRLQHQGGDTQTPQTQALLHCFAAYALRVLGSYEEALAACGSGFALLGRLAHQQSALDEESRQRLTEELSALYGTLSRERDTIRQGQWMEQTYGSEAQRQRERDLEGDDPFDETGRMERLETALQRAPGSRLTAIAAAELRAASTPLMHISADEDDDDEWVEEPALFTGYTSAVAGALVVWTLLSLTLPGARSTLEWTLGTIGAVLVGAGGWMAWTWLQELHGGRARPAIGVGMLVLGAVGVSGALAGGGSAFVPLAVAGLGVAGCVQLLATTYARHRGRALHGEHPPRV